MLKLGIIVVVGLIALGVAALLTRSPAEQPHQTDTPELRERTQLQLEIVIRPGISPRARHEIEDELGHAGFEIVGGGGWVDGSQSDIGIAVYDPQAALPHIRNILRRYKVGQESYICEEYDDDGNPVRAHHIYKD